jgi:hypothetical protein
MAHFHSPKLNDTYIQAARRALADGGSIQKPNAREIQRSIDAILALNPSLAVFPTLGKAGTLYSTVPSFSDFTVTRASTKNVLGSNGLYQSVANNVPAFEFNTDGTYRGLLVEPGATNQIRNNSMVGAVAGTPGTLPTNWIVVSSGGLSRQIVAIGADNGVEYIDLRLFGTASSGNALFGLETSGVISATSSQVWTHSGYLKVVAATLPPLSYLMGAVYTNAGGYVNQTDTVVSVDGTLSRKTITLTTPGSTIDSLYPTLRFNLTNGNSYDFTVRIGWPQMETGSVATSPIVTTAGTANRAADVVSLTGASSLIGQSEGVVYAEVDFSKATANNTTKGFIFDVNDNTNNNRVRINWYRSSLGVYKYEIRIRANNVASYTADPDALTQGFGTIKLAFAYKGNDVAIYENGALLASSSSVNLSGLSLNIIDLGHSFDNTLQMNDTLRAVALFPTRLPNATLASITA